ncbi:MAG: signal recognition particle-docking protein FtsY [Paracoccaceae bacterium]
MAFFKKLKDRLFKSSSKLEEGLEAIVGDGGEEELADLKGAQEPALEAENSDASEAVEAAAALDAADEETAPEVALPVEAEPVEAEVAVETEVAVEAAVEADAVEVKEPETKEPVDAGLQDVATKAPDEADDTPTASKEAEETPVAPAEATRIPEPEPEPEPEPVVPTPVAPPAPKAAPPIQAPAPIQETAAPQKAESEKPGLLGRLLGRGEKQGDAAKPAEKSPKKPAKTILRRALDDEMIEQLEELLITADMGVDTALRVTANMAEGRFGKKLSVDEIKGLMAGEIARIMEPVAKPMPLYPKKPQVVLVVGVNGSGKTTTIGKLAAQFRAAGKSVVIAAGDTFRAAAVEQLQVWGERAGVPVLTAPEGSDPASLAFDAMTKAEADGTDLLLIDTAGRLQNRADLMEELAKIVRVIRKKDPSAPHNTLLVLDATTGQNAINQVETFRALADVTGLIMTKLDGTARGGVLVALADKFGLPIHAIGVGEQIDDLSPFDPDEFAAALTGRDL